MIITIGGKAGSGKSTISKLLAKMLNFKHYSIGDLQRELAKEKGITLLELGKLEEKDKSIDLELDNKQKKLGKNEDDFVIDGRLSSFFIPKAKLKIFLDADEKIRALRIIRDNREEEKLSSVKKAIESMRLRERSENTRYQKYYGYDCYNLKNYDLILNTTDKTPKQIVEIILRNLDDKKDY